MLNFTLPGTGFEAPLLLATIPEGALITAGASGAAGAGLSGLTAIASAAPAALSFGNVLSGAQALGSLAGGVGSLSQGMQKAPGAPPMPGIPSPTEMPDPESKAVRVKAQRDAALRSQVGGGRASTFLTDLGSEEKLG